MIELTGDIRDRLARAAADGYPVVVASVRADGQPRLAFYGSTHVFDRDRLAIWARDSHGGLVERVADNPRVTLLYRHADDRVMWQFEGRARRDDDPAVRERVYRGAPERERAADPEAHGAAVIIELDRVIDHDVVWQRDRPDATA